MRSVAVKAQDADHREHRLRGRSRPPRLLGACCQPTEEHRVTRRRRATLSDVAARAGVSRTTASYILNGHSERMRIAPETEQRVRDAIDALCYRPNRNARSLRTLRTSTIGVITDYIAGGAYASQLLAGANVAAREADHLLLIGESEGDAIGRDLLIDEMVDRQVDGIIYATHTALELELPPRLRGQRVVMLNCRQPEPTVPAVPAVLADDEAGGYAAARALLDAGIDTDIVVVGEAPDGPGIAGTRRLSGIVAALAEAGVSLADVISCDWDPEPAYVATSAWLAQGNRARGLICMNDRAALGTYRVLLELGIDVPRDVSVVSFDGSDLASWLRPRVTSMSLPLREMGARAVELLLDETATEPTLTMLPMLVTDGDSVRSGGADA